MIDGWKNRGVRPGGCLRSPRRRGYAFGKGKSALPAISGTAQIAERGGISATCCWRPSRILKNHPDILADYRERFRYMLVDEYQDTNVVQYLWLKLLATKNGNLCVVGDDDQSIYAWRGAEVENILRFERDFAGAKVIRLGAELPFHSGDPGRGFRPDCRQQGPAGQDIVDRRRARRENPGARRVGRRRRSPQCRRRSGRPAPPGPSVQPDGDPGAGLLPDARIQRTGLFPWACLTG